MSERVYRLGRGPWHHKCVGFGASYIAGCEIAQILAERWGAVTGDEVAARVHVAFSLSMGIEREDRLLLSLLQFLKKCLYLSSHYL